MLLNIVKRIVKRKWLLKNIDDDKRKSFVDIQNLITHDLVILALVLI